MPTHSALTMHVRASTDDSRSHPVTHSSTSKPTSGGAQLPMCSHASRQDGPSPPPSRHCSMPTHSALTMHVRASTDDSRSHPVTHSSTSKPTSGGTHSSTCSHTSWHDGPSPPPSKHCSMPRHSALTMHVRASTDDSRSHPVTHSSRSKSTPGGAHSPRCPHAS